MRATEEETELGCRKELSRHGVTALQSAVPEDCASLHLPLSSSLVEVAHEITQGNEPEEVGKPCQSFPVEYQAPTRGYIYMGPTLPFRNSPYNTFYIYLVTTGLSPYNLTKS